MSYYHKKYLIELTSNPTKHIDFNNKSLEKIIVEPVWLSENGDEISLCDAILIFSNYAIPLELKQSILKREKAIKQLKNGQKYIKEQLNLNNIDYGIFTIYNSLIHPQNNPFIFENIIF